MIATGTVIPITIFVELLLFTVTGGVEGELVVIGMLVDGTDDKVEDKLDEGVVGAAELLVIDVAESSVDPIVNRLIVSFPGQQLPL